MRRRVSSWLTWLFAPLSLLLAVHAALHLALRRSRRLLPACDDDEDALPFAVLMRAFVAECGASVLQLALSLGASLSPTRRGDEAAGVRLVLLHGLGQSRGALAWLAARLAARGWQVVSHPWPPFSTDVQAGAESLRRLLDQLQAERPGPVHLVGFGLGGLVARTCVRRYRVPGVRRLVTIGTPHQGTLLAPPWPRRLGALRPGSELLRRLAAADHSAAQFEATAIQSELDATILPPDAAYYPAALNVIVRDTGHYTMLFSPRIVDLVDENLRSDA